MSNPLCPSLAQRLLHGRVARGEAGKAGQGQATQERPRESVCVGVGPSGQQLPPGEAWEVVVCVGRLSYLDAHRCHGDYWVLEEVSR